MTHKSPLVCLTGGTGFIGSHIARFLLARGYDVRLLVRQGSERKINPALLGARNAKGRLGVRIYNLLDLDSCLKGTAGAKYVIHCACPYRLEVEDPQVELVEVAKVGTYNMLESCRYHKEVCKLVVTSSVAAITDQPSSKIYDERVWNSRSSLKRNPYYFAKTCAEKFLWEELENNCPTNLQVVAVIPSTVVGPSLVKGVNESNKIIAMLLKGQFPGVIDMSWNFVDVRDVAVAHVLAMEHSGLSGRLLCSHETVHMRDIISHLKGSGFGDFPLPKVRLDNLLFSQLIRLASYCDTVGKGSYVRTHIGTSPQYNNNRIKSVLNFEFRPIVETLADTAESLVNR